ncbi:MAG TPA: hypothetical protein VK188_09085 [Holophaga sp.]|nr:hypothetical protein [Holophaga sp.]
MKFWPIALLVLLGCGGGGSSRPSAPSISNLQFQTPLVVIQGSNGGYSTVQGTFDFLAPSADITTGVLEAVDTSGNVQSSLSFPISDLLGHKSGTAYVVASFMNTQVGDHPFALHVQTSAGLKSNKLMAVFTVIPGAADVVQDKVDAKDQPAIKDPQARLRQSPTAQP